VGSYNRKHIGDNMKKIITILMALVLMGSPVLAQYTPLPISGTVSVRGAGIDVTIENLDTGEVITTHTNKEGFFIVDWANAEEKYRPGDEFKITVADKSKTEVYEGSPIEVEFIFEECPECPPCNCPSIPEDCPEDTTPYDECDSCCDCPVIPEKKEDYYLEGIVAILSGALGALFGYKKGPKKLIEYAEKNFKKGQYVRLGKYYNGAITAKHMHKGIVGYHDPDREHQDEDAKHPPGELAGKNVPGD